MNTVDRVTSCPEFVMSVMGDVDTGKPYKPIEPHEVKNAVTMQLGREKGELNENT